MKKIIFLFSLSLIIVHIGLNIYNIYCYEEQKEEWGTVFKGNEKYFNYVIEYLNKPFISENIYHIDLNDKIDIKCTDIIQEDVLNDDDLFIALEKIKSCGIILVLKYDGYGGWNFIKQISDKKTDIGFHEIGIYYTQNKSKDSINHIEGNWFFRNTKYNIHKEKKIYRHVYNLIFNNM